MASNNYSENNTIKTKFIRRKRSEPSYKLLNSNKLRKASRLEVGGDHVPLGEFDNDRAGDNNHNRGKNTENKREEYFKRSLDR